MAALRLAMAPGEGLARSALFHKYVDYGNPRRAADLKSARFFGKGKFNSARRRGAQLS